MVELYPGFFAMLRLAKNLHDSALRDKISYSFRTLTLDEDFYCELACEAISIIFEKLFPAYNEDLATDVYVFCDPIIDKFCQLCWQYEQRRHLTEDKNPYRQRIEAVIHSGFCLSGYSYNFDWKLSVNDRGRRRLLFFYGPEFCSLEELPEGLLEIRNGFLELNLALETALNELTKEKVKGAA